MEIAGSRCVDFFGSSPSISAQVKLVTDQINDRIAEMVAQQGDGLFSHGENSGDLAANHDP